VDTVLLTAGLLLVAPQAIGQATNDQGDSGYSNVVTARTKR
jgi:hypothetical protein